MNYARWRSWAVPVAGVLLLASSFGPWWVLQLQDSGRLAPDGTHLTVASAWEASRWWALAVAGALAVVLVWIGWRLITGRVPDWLRGLLILASTAPILLAVHQWQSIPTQPEWPPTPPNSAVARVNIQPGSEFTHTGIVPDRLYRDDSPISWQGPGWGLYAGITCLALVTTALLVSGQPDRRPPAPAR